MTKTHIRNSVESKIEELQELILQQDQRNKDFNRNKVVVDLDSMKDFKAIMRQVNEKVASLETKLSLHEL